VSLARGSETSATASERRVSRRRRERISDCVQATQEEPESRVSGLPAGDRLTLGQLLDSVWEGLCAGGMAECPVCHGGILSGTAGSAARCESCGAAIA
jgi:hypothetical protein